ncbi:MAG: hypothetical protein WBG04_18130 [Haloferula sp.]
MDEERFPNVTPWDFSPRQSDLHPTLITIHYCPQCDAEFDAGFEKFRQLPEEDKEAAFDARLRRQIQKDKEAEQDGDGDA